MFFSTMLSRDFLPVGAILLGAVSVRAEIATCSLEKKCPEETPCCSREYSLDIQMSWYLNDTIANCFVL